MMKKIVYILVSILFVILTAIVITAIFVTLSKEYPERTFLFGQLSNMFCFFAGYPLAILFDIIEKKFKVW